MSVRTELVQLGLEMEGVSIMPFSKMQIVEFGGEQLRPPGRRKKTSILDSRPTFSHKAGSNW